MLGFLYAVFFAVQVYLLIRCCRRKKGLGKLLLLNIFSAVLSGFLLWYFDTLPGYGIMPGFAYFPEVIYSLCAGAVFAVLSFVTLLLWLLRKK